MIEALTLGMDMEYISDVRIWLPKLFEYIRGEEVTK